MQILFGQCPVGVKSEFDRLAQIDANFLEGRTLGVATRNLLDESGRYQPTVVLRVELEKPVVVCGC